MTLSSALDLAGKLRPWLTTAAAVVLGGLLLRQCHETARVSEEAAAARQTAALKAQGAPVVDQVQDLGPRLQEALAANGDLRAAVADLEARVKRAGARAAPTAVLQASTGPVPAAAGATPATPRPGDPGSPSGQGCPVCLFRPGDQGEAQVAGLEERTDLGVDLVAGSTSCSRVDPGGQRVRLFGGPWQATLLRAAEVAPPATSDPGWGGSAFGVCVADRCAGGGAVDLPPFRVWHLQVEASAGAGGGPGGAAVLAKVGGRWR